ncbi:hypothetical protein RvY_17050 [Ramazzottius varieornatus]|uniref:Uncharacterized protein n=1 Tax=Ramazzottius varieornatus TaxID=947166 RepID=A0A1D1W0R9_RAMVA|nr:hypothetical protein RvY_17050 [Ramazzottius varieornatus]
MMGPSLCITGLLVAACLFIQNADGRSLWDLVRERDEAVEIQRQVPMIQERADTPAATNGQLTYVYGYAPPPPSLGTSGPYVLYQGLAPGMVMVPLSQLNTMFSQQGRTVLKPLPDSASPNFVPMTSG